MANAGFILHDGAYVARDSKLGKMLVVHEQPNYRPEQNPYPKAMYMARRRPDGKIACQEVAFQVFMEAQDKDELPAHSRMNAFNTGNFKVVGQGPMRQGGEDRERDKREEQTALEAGWRPTQQEALAHAEAREQARENETAFRHHTDSKTLSPRALAEAAVIDSATDAMLPEITPDVVRDLTAENEALRRQLQEMASAPKAAKRGRRPKSKPDASAAA